MPPLSNVKHELIAQNLAKGMSATEAHEKAGYKRNDSNASKLANNPDVRARLTEITGVALRNTTITQERVLKELATIGFSNISDFVDLQDGGVTVKDLKKIPPEVLGVVGEVSQGRYGPTIKMHSKIAALRLIANMMGFERIAQTNQTINVDMSNIEIARRIGFMFAEAMEQLEQKGDTSR